MLLSTSKLLLFLLAVAMVLRVMSETQYLHEVSLHD